MNRSSSARRLSLALAIALLLHVGVAALLVLMPRRLPPRRKTPPPMVVEILKAPLRKAAPPEPPAPAGSEQPPLPPAKVAKEAHPQPLIPERKAESAAAKPVAPQGGLPASPEPSKTPPAPQAALGGPAGQGGQTAAANPGGANDSSRPARGFVPGQRLSLELPAGALVREGGGEGSGAGTNGLVREPSAEEKLAEEKHVVEGRIRGWINDTAARQRAQAPREQVWQDMQDKLAQDFKPDWDVLDKAGGGGAARVLGEAAQQWQRTASAYGKSGNPFGEDGPGSRRALSDEVTSLDPEERGFRGDAALGHGLSAPLALGAGGGDGPFNHRLVVFVMITQAADGSIEDVRVQGGSGNRYYDGLALSRAKSLSAGTLGVPPKDHRQSLWAFETDFIQIPPLPIFGCAMDALVIPRECYYPLKKMVKSRLRLEAIY